MWEFWLSLVGIIGAAALLVENLTKVGVGLEKIYKFIAKIFARLANILFRKPKFAIVNVVTSPSPSIVGQAFSLSVNVTSDAGTPTGAVNIYEGSESTVNLIAGPFPITGSGAVAVPVSIAAGHLKVGTHTYTVVYDGDSIFKANHKTITHIVKPGSAKPYIARICWNTRNWEKPSGQPKIGGPGLFDVINGFGFEEWLFSDRLNRNGWRYSFVEGVRFHAADADPDIFLAVYAIGPNDKGGNAKYLIGRMKCHVLSRSEADDAFEYFKQSGAIKEMRTHVVAVKGNVNLFDNWARPGSGLFNLRYKPADLVVWNPRVEVPNGLFIPPLGRYQEMRPLDNGQCEAVRQLLSQGAVQSIT